MSKWKGGCKNRLCKFSSFFERRGIGWAKYPAGAIVAPIGVAVGVCGVGVAVCAGAVAGPVAVVVGPFVVLYKCYEEREQRRKRAAILQVVESRYVLQDRDRLRNGAGITVVG